MSKAPITIKDIAKALKLSHSTISRALKDSYQIGEETKKRVKAYAKAHNYHPNLMAQSLKNQKTRSIGVILSSVSKVFFAEVITGIESVASAKDYHVIITQSMENFEKEKNNLDQLTWRSIDGLLVSISAQTTDFSQFKSIQESGTPIVFFDRITHELETHTVIADNHQGAFDLTKHLIDQGFKRIAHITSSEEIFTTKARLAGYTDALKLAGIPFDQDLIRYCEQGGVDTKEVEKQLSTLLSLDNPPDAVFAASDLISLSSFDYLQQKGIKIPEELAFAGFSNFSAPQLFNPGLTTVKQPAFEMGKQAMELLLELVESKRPVSSFKHVSIPTELQIRKSTKGRS
jgi:DNA-binding LacI/PurR family transcriptional regulator